MKEEDSVGRSHFDKKTSHFDRTQQFTHETEKDKTENVFLDMTKLGKTKLGT